MTYKMKRHTDNYSSMLRLDRAKTLLMMLLMMMGGGVVTGAWAQEPAGVQTVVEGKPYRIRTTMIEGMQLSTKENTVRNTTPAIGIFMTDYFAKDQIFYFEATSTNYFIKDAEGKYVNSDGFKTYAGNYVDNNNHKYAIEPVSGTNYVKFKCAGSKYLAPGRGFVNGSPVYGDGGDRTNTNTYTMILWKIIPWDPVADFKVLIDAVATYKDNDATLSTAYDAAVATYESYKTTSITDMLDNTGGALTAVAGGISDLTTARDNYLQSIPKPTTGECYIAWSHDTGKLLTRPDNNTDATLTTPISANNKMTLESDGTNYYIKNGDYYLAVKGTRAVTYGNNYDTDANVLTTEWKNKKDEACQLNLRPYGNGHFGIQFKKFDNYSTTSSTGGYLDPGPCTDLSKLYPLREDGITNPLGYWTFKLKGPSIIYNPGTNTATISCSTPGATIYYAMGDADVVVSTDGEGYSGSVTTAVLDQSVTTIKAVSKLGDIELSAILTIPFQTTAGTNERPYLIQQYNNKWSDGTIVYYMIPDSPNGYANTTNVPRPTMEWFIKYETTEDGIVYYSLQNKVTGEYLYYDSDLSSGSSKGIVLKASNEYSSSDNGFKFRITPYGTNYNIVPYGLTSGNMYVHKGNSNTSQNPVTLNNSQNNGNSLWNIVTRSALDLTPPFDVATATCAPYYKLNNVGADTLYITPPTEGTNVVMSTTTDKTVDWYFEEAQAASDSDWNTYYYIRHGLTGQYLYYAGNIPHNNNQCFELRSTVVEGAESRYMFTWVRHQTTAGQYEIVPHFLLNETQNYTSVIKRDNYQLKANITRNENNSTWTFVAANDMKVATPVFVYDNVQNTFSISCSTPGTKIYYKGYNDGGSQPMFTFPDDRGTLYTRPFQKEYDNYVAIAVRCIDDGSDQSDPATGNANSMLYSYHIIDKSHQDLLQIGSNAETLGLPTAYRSPLVMRYHYFTAANFNTETNMPTGSEMTSLSDLGEGEQDIYVTYDVSSRIKLDGSQYYMLRYENPNGTELYEEANDRPKGFPENTQNTVYYPYTNGKEGFNLYGDEKRTATFDDGESTRTRYLWYFEGGDPYHVKIRSFNTTGTSYHADAGPYASYFYTFYGDGDSSDNDDTDATTHTVLTQSDRSDHQPTEYMVLNGHGGSSSFPYRLMTTAKDATTNRHMEVSTFDHQWLNAAKNDATYTSRTTNWYQMPDLGSDFTKVNSNRGTEEPKTITLWYETVDMGTDFQIEQVTLYPVLHLVDNHGWEIAHWTMESTEACKNRIKQFASPLVKEYRWYKGESNTGLNKPIVKVSGYYKYYINGTVSGSEPVAVTKDLTSDWLHVNFEDVSQNYNFYVFYDALDNYSNDNRYLVDLGGQLAESDGGAISYTTSGSDYHTDGVLKEEVTITDNLQWIISPNTDIDVENAFRKYSGYTKDYVYDTDATSEAAGRPEPGKDASRFDPYSLRIETAAGGSYYTVNGSTYAISLTDGTATQFTYNDRADLSRDNRGTTFMAVQGTDGKMRLVLRNSDHAEQMTRALDNGGTATVTAAATTVRQTVVLVPLRQNIYTIVRSDGTKVISSTGYTSTLHVPDDIASPLLDDTYYSFYPTEEDARNKTNPLDNATFASLYNAPVYVRYDEKVYNNTPIDLSGTTTYTMRNSGQYLSHEAGTTAFAATTPSDTELGQDKYLWKFAGGDPYTVQVLSKNGDDVFSDTTFIWLGSSTYGWHLIANTPPEEGKYAYLYNDGEGQPQQHRLALGTTTTADHFFIEAYNLGSYTYHIINTSGTEAVKYTVKQRSVTPLNYDNLPAAIRSPYIEDETLSFYSDAACTSAITTAAEASTHIYVKYTTTRLDDKRLDLSGMSGYKMRVGGTYVHDDGGTPATTGTDNWVLIGGDPYAVEIKSVTGNRSLSYDTSGPSLSFDGDNKTFILLSGTSSTLVELMAATGTDVAETYYHIGLDNGSFSLYSSTAHQQGDAALQVNFSKVDGTVVEIAFSSEMNADPAGHYKAVAGFSIDETIGTFTGEFDGDFQEISSATRPLFATADGAKIKNVIFQTVNISGGTNAGAIANTAQGDARIYNCGVLGGTVSGSGNVGSLVGTLDGTARVINCYSYANVSGGTYAAGIVGYNSYASKNNDLKTMVMNCMFYGNVESGTNISPVYGGVMIDNSGSTGLNNFNYFLADNFTDFITRVTDYNCALGAEERFLTRFEFYRQILNSNLPLAAWYATGSAANYKDEMAKWVLETADRTIANPKPYPDLRPHGSGAFYPSIINIDAAHANAAADPEGADRNTGCRLGTLNVRINLGSAAPSGAAITTSTRTLNITDKDEARYNFNYYKVQLPYYNEVGVGNYTDNKVVTGWEITSITGGTPGSYTTGSDVTLDGDGNVTATPYNFADRDCTQKDLYDVSGRVFAQGAYFDVPNGVTAITIRAHWAKAAYLSDPCYDKTYNNSFTGYDITAMGTRYTKGSSYNINGSNQVVYTTMGDAIDALGRTTGSSVYDYAVVLVGNYHHYYKSNPIKDDTDGFTIMSADFDLDNEPDNCFFYQHEQRRNISPVRFDFLCWPGIGMAQKPSDSNRLSSIGIFNPRGWFEVTNTCLAQFSQVEYNNGMSSAAPYILLGGVVEQIVSGNTSVSDKTQYLHLGGSAWFKMFSNGSHMDKDHKTPHIPISVTGGDFDSFYLSGMFRPSVKPIADNAECYISGGRFGEVAGAGQEQINGNVTWMIDHADIENFYGGGVNSEKPVTGNINTIIKNSHVGEFCGGPKFGDMTIGKTVTTNATKCTFGAYYGAGYGGTSLYRYGHENSYNVLNYNFNQWAYDHYGRSYNSKYNGIATSYEYELIPRSGFSADENVGRFYVNYASLSLATTRNVTSTLTGCKITDNFYGGGSLGKVDGDVTSTLTDCEVKGNVFGAGFSAAAPTVEVLPKPTASTDADNVAGAGYVVRPWYDTNSGFYIQGVYPKSVTYTWKQAASVSTNNEFEDDGDKHYILTTVDMTTLGTVTGTARLTIGGNSVIGTAGDATKGNVFGGGDESAVSNATTSANAKTIVTLQDNAKVLGNVFGGGNEGVVSGNTTVNMTGGSVLHDVFGGGKGIADSFQCEKGMVGVDTEGATNPSDGTTVTISSGTVGGSVYGGGEVGRVEENAKVTIGEVDGSENAGASPVIKGNVFGAGKGLNTHGYAALVRGNATVTVQGNARVEHSVYGGGEIASVGKYTIAEDAEDAAAHGVEEGMPYSLASDNCGICTVTVSGYAVIGQDDMKMTAEGGPDDFGYVFGAGKGVLPYEGTDNEDNKPRRMNPENEWEYYNATDYDGEGDYEAAYLKYIETLALTTETYVTIDGHAFVKGSVYGGSENGHVLHDTKVYIKGNCQIGNGDGVNARYSEEQFVNPLTTTVTSGNALAECSHWPYRDPYLPYDKYDSAGGDDHATDGHTFFGNVFGGGSGLYPYQKPDNTYEWLRTAGRVYGNTYVEITGGHILTSVYGGCELADVGNGLTVEEGRGTCRVKMSGGTLGVPRTLEQIAAHPVTCYLFGAGKGDQRTRFNEWTNVGNVIVEINDSVSRPIIYGSVFGGGEDGHVLGNVDMHIKEMKDTGGPIIGTWGTSYVEGNVFGAGRGFGGGALTAGVVSGNVNMRIDGGTMLGSVYGGGRLGSVGTHLVAPTDPRYGTLVDDGKQQVMDQADSDAEGVKHGYITINVNGGTIGNRYEYVYPTAEQKTDSLRNTSFDYRNRLLYTKGGNIFTGCMGRLYGLDGTTLLPDWADMGKARKTTLNITGGTIKSNVYGGGELGTLVEGATISITGGTVGTLVPAGEGDDQPAYYYGSVFGGGKGSTDNITGKWPAGTAEADKKDISVAGQVGGNVLVELNKGVAPNAKGGVVHQMFGCNDMNGTPKGTVTVHVYNTQNEAATRIANDEESGVTTAKVAGRYDVEAVYGGGNLAAYVPTNAVSGTAEQKNAAFAHVIIDGCEQTSIRQVYGGGNAASTPATKVDINGTFEVEEAFGGGNGKDKLPTGADNPGANVGFYDYSAKDAAPGGDGTYDTKEKRQATEFVNAYTYGSGMASMNIHGGTVHRVYGGSNTKGNVREVALTLLEDESGCPFCVDEAYGGGKSAPMDAESRLEMACIPGLKAAYGGAEDAQIEGNVNLTITNGTFDRVFGGNNVSGHIKGTITVNIEETGCKPVIIGQLYGGGNQAPYVAPEGEHGPTLNVRSFTSIGEVYGGGYGKTAVVTGDTYVNINETAGKWASGFTYSDETTVADKTGNKTITFIEYLRTDDGGFVLDGDGNRTAEEKEVQLYLPPLNTGKIGGINRVYGGGNAAKVDGNTHVNIGTAIGESVVFETPRTKETADPEDDEKTITENTTDEERTHTVTGADIRDNVYGGGNAAEVTGNTYVVVGKATE